MTGVPTYSGVFYIYPIAMSLFPVIRNIFNMQVKSFIDMYIILKPLQMQFKGYGQFLKPSLICEYLQHAFWQYITTWYCLIKMGWIILCCSLNTCNLCLKMIWCSRAWDMRTMESLCRACKYAVSLLNCLNSSMAILIKLKE